MQAQDIIRDMFLTDGNIVFRAAKVTPMNLVGIKVADDNGVRIEPTYTHVQIVTARGRVINARLADEFTLI